MNGVSEFKVEQPKGYQIIGVSDILKTIGVDEEEYQFITIDLAEEEDSEYEVVSGSIKKTFFPESALYKKLQPIAETDEKERPNLLNTLKKIRLRKFTAVVAPYYVSYRNKKGEIIKQKYHDKHANAGQAIMSRNVTIYLLDGEDAGQELDAWMNRTAGAGMFVKFEDVEKLKKEYKTEPSLALLNFVPNLKAFKTAPKETETPEENGE